MTTTVTKLLYVVDKMIDMKQNIMDKLTDEELQKGYLHEIYSLGVVRQMILDEKFMDHMVETYSEGGNKE